MGDKKKDQPWLIGAIPVGSGVKSLVASGTNNGTEVKSKNGAVGKADDKAKMAKSAEPKNDEENEDAEGGEEEQEVDDNGAKKKGKKGKKKKDKDKDLTPSKISKTSASNSASSGVPSGAAVSEEPGKLDDNPTHVKTIEFYQNRCKAIQEVRKVYDDEDEKDDDLDVMKQKLVKEFEFQMKMMKYNNSPNITIHNAGSSNAPAPQPIQVNVPTTVQTPAPIINQQPINLGSGHKKKKKKKRKTNAEYVQLTVESIPLSLEKKIRESISQLYKEPVPSSHHESVPRESSHGSLPSKLSKESSRPTDMPSIQTATSSAPRRDSSN